MTPSKPEPGTEYASLRIIEPAHKLRFGHGAKLVESTADQTIIFRPLPFPHFDIAPTGIQIPLHNVASAIPKGAALAARVRKTTGGRVEKDPVDE